MRMLIKVQFVRIDQCYLLTIREAAMERESMEFDVVIVGAGPAGLACAIALAQQCQSQKRELSICVLEKGASVGAHILSGAVIETNTLTELIPDWQEQGAPVSVQVTEDQFLLLNEHKARRLPTLPNMNNHGNYIISLGKLCAWLGQQAEQLGVSLFPGFAAASVLYDCDGSVVGVQTGDMGIGKSGEQTARFQAGINLYAKQTIFAEGCRGSLTEQVIKKFDLRKHCDPQTYGIGIKELWKIDPANHTLGKVVHTIGWPLDRKTYGGSFLYHADDLHLAIGFVIGLDYQNPYLDPFKEFQRFKLHPTIKPLFDNAECVQYGARALNEGGWQSIPQLTFKGGMIIGCSAGFLNVAKIKGTHNAMRSGMLAAEAIFEANNIDHQQLISYQQKIENSPIAKELKKVRNIRPAFTRGLWSGLIYSAIDQFIFRGKAPWTFHHHADHKATRAAKNYTPIHYEKPDGKITFDRLSQVYLSGTRHNEDQPTHLKILNPDIPINLNLKQYAAPEQRYCPAGVYEIVEREGKPHLQINFANCVHCKTCDIKDPSQNIQWVTPEGGDGPNYTFM